MPLTIKYGQGAFTRLFQVILAGNPDGSLSAHMKGNEGNLPIRTHIQSLRMMGPLDGAPGVSTAGHPLCRFIPRSGCPEWL
jgi:hypothetical protein